MTIDSLTWQKDWMATFGGHAVFPLGLKVEEIRLTDIAHALSQQARYNGHTKYPYWVGQHCVLISRALERDGQSLQMQRIGLLHDASETYTGDLTKPMKNSIKHKLEPVGMGGMWKEIEHEIEAKIAERFHLPYPWPFIVEEYDTRITQDEKAALFVKQDAVWTIPLPPLNVRIEECSWRLCEADFLLRARELGLE